MEIALHQWTIVEKRGGKEIKGPCEFCYFEFNFHGCDMPHKRPKISIDNQVRRSFEGKNPFSKTLFNPNGSTPIPLGLIQI